MKLSKVISILILCLVSSVSAKSKPRIHVQKAFLHEGALLDQLVLYFSQRPICNYIPSKDVEVRNGQPIALNKSGVAELEFFMPLTDIASKEAGKFMAQLKATDNDLYKIEFEPDYTRNGLVCRVIFRPEEVGFQQEAFEAITGHQALSFSFLKLKKAKDLKQKGKPLLRSAQLKKKPVWQ